MNRTKLLVAGGALALFLAGSLMRSPHSEAKGAFSSPVTVMNTNANSVPSLDVERAARTPYESTSQPTGTCAAGLGQCFFVFPAPPAGSRLVVENVSGWITLSSSATAPPHVLLSNVDIVRNTYWSFTGTMGPLFNTVIQSGINQTLRAVYDSSDNPPAITVTANFQGSIGQFMTLSGYLENCAISGCLAKVH